MTVYFSNTKLGQTIASQRKVKNLTQSEVAEALGVSHQAVSSWENGLTCPDISKLSQLSSLLDISIDTLLGNDRIGDIIHKVENDQPLEEEEVIVVAPLTKPTQLESILDNMDAPSFHIETMIAIAPFVDAKHIESFIKQHEGTIQLKQVTALAPFLESKHLLHLIENHVDSGDLSAITSLAPFLEYDDIGAIIDKIHFTGTLSDITPLAPFASKETLSMLIRNHIQSDSIDIKGLTSLAPFLSQEDVDYCFEYISTSSLTDLVSLAPFASKKTLSKAVMNQSEKEDFSGHSLTALAPFLDTQVIRDIVEKEMNKGNFESIRTLFPFM